MTLEEFLTYNTANIPIYLILVQDGKFFPQFMDYSHSLFQFLKTKMSPIEYLSYDILNVSLDLIENEAGKIVLYNLFIIKP